MRINRAILLFITILGQNLYAQSVLRFQHINVEDGLSQSTVNYFFQDAHGFIWLATGDGLNRYDGKQFIVYKSHFSGIARTPVSDRNINSKIFEDKYNRLWFSSDAGVSYMDTRTGRFAVVLDKYSTVCSGLLSSIDSGSLWVATAHKGFLCVNIENSKIDIYPFTDKWQINNDVNPLTSSAATKRAIWVTDKYGLICFDKHTKRDQRKLLKGGLNSVNVLKNGNLLLGYKDGVFLYNTGNDRIEFITIKEISEKKEIEWRTFAEDTLSGTVYLGSSVGGTICKLDLRNRKYQLLNFQNNTICDLFIDRSENLWIGTDGNGACKLDISPPKFFCFGPRPVYAETEQTSFFVTSIYRAGNGKIWMGVVNDGLVVYDPSTSRQQKIPLSLTDAEQVIRSIFADSAGHLVVAVSNSVLWLDPVSYKIIGTTTLPRQPQINSVKPIVYALTEWKKGHYFAGTNLGVYAVTFEKNHPKSWMPGAFQKDTFLTVWPYNFYKAGNGSTYIGMRRGFINITILSDSQIHINDVGFRDIPVRHFYKSAQYSILWIASEQGLIAYNEQTKQYRIFDEKDGMPNSFVYAILDQNDSMLWISTNKGITNAKVHYTSNGNVTAEFVNYGVRDGLQSDEFNTGAYFKDKDGMLYFGGIAGINWFDPRNVKPSPLKASPAISGIYVNDSLYAGDTAVYVRKIILPYTRNTISLS